MFQPGIEWPHSPNAYRRTEPDKYEQRSLHRVAGRVLGTGCVVCERNDPRQLARAGLRLVPPRTPPTQPSGS